MENALNQLVKRGEDGIRYSYSYDKPDNLIFTEALARSFGPGGAMHTVTYLKINIIKDIFKSR